MVFADNGDVAGVVGPVPAAAFAVVVGCVRVQAGTGVARVAFACFFGFRGLLSIRFFPGFGAMSETDLPPFRGPFSPPRGRLPSFAFELRRAVIRPAAPNAEKDGEARSYQSEGS